MPSTEATGARSAVTTVLASFLPPTRAARLAADLAGSAAPLEQAVAELRRRYDAAGPALAAALDAAGVGVATTARLVGTDVVTVNRWLDQVDGTTGSIRTTGS